MITSTEVEQIGRVEGLLAAAKRIGYSNLGETELIKALAQGASLRNELVSDVDLAEIKALNGSNFFELQMVLCDVIPYLSAPTSDVMNLVAALVETGGEDLAANQPNAAFRQWCANDVRRADDVIASAREGHELALNHLVFALQAKNDFEAAMQSAGAGGDERTAGVLALSRIKLGEQESTRALDVVLKISQSLVPKDAAGLLKAALDIASKHPAIERSKIATELNRLSETTDPTAVHLMASALYWHGEEMSDNEIASCLLGIQKVNPENSGTVRQIDDALRKMWPSRSYEVGQTISALICKSKGKVGNHALSGILSEGDAEEGQSLTQLATEWLLKGNYELCASLASHFSEINRTTPCLNVTPSDLPTTAAEQVFVCRKAVGHFFLSPMTAAAWIVAVIRSGGPAAKDAVELLFDPLLMNYGGALKKWLEELLTDDLPGNNLIEGTLKRAQKVWDSFEAVREVVELQPSSAKRALLRFQEEEEAEQVHNSAREKSIFADLFTTQTLLYGDRSSFSIVDGEGNRRPQTVNMAAMSVSSELPKGIFFDPTGTEWTLEVFKQEQRPKE